MNYFQIRSLSNSLMDRLFFYYDRGIMDKFTKDEEEEVKDSQALFEGTQFHLSMETNGESLSKLIYVDDACLDTLTPTEKKFVDTNMEIEDYINIYDNVDTRFLKENLNMIFIDDQKKFDKIKLKIQSKIDEIKEKVKDYLEEIKKYDNTDYIVLNKLDYLSNKKNIIEELVDLYNYTSFFEDKFCPKGTKLREVEVYWEEDGVECKGKIDLVIITDGKVYLYDYKTKDFRISEEKAILKYSMCRRLSYYKKGLEEQLNLDLPVECHILFTDKKYRNVTDITLSKHAIECGQTGGYEKPYLYTKYNIHEEFDPFMKESDISFLISNNIWSGENKEFWKHGWEKGVEIAKKHNVL